MELGIRGAAILLLGVNPICLCALYDFYAALAIACAILMAVAVLYEGACVAALLLLPSWLLRLSTISLKIHSSSFTAKAKCVLSIICL